LKSATIATRFTLARKIAVLHFTSSSSSTSNITHYIHSILAYTAVTLNGENINLQLRHPVGSRGKARLLAVAAAAAAQVVSAEREAIDGALQG
jgi:hypothetical protein